MRAGEVLDILKISRLTLKRYREKGYLIATELPTGQFDYDAESVYGLRGDKLGKRDIVEVPLEIEKIPGDSKQPGYVFLFPTIALGTIVVDKSSIDDVIEFAKECLVNEIVAYKQMGRYTEDFVKKLHEQSELDDRTGVVPSDKIWTSVQIDLNDINKYTEALISGKWPDFNNS